MTKTAVNRQTFFGFGELGLSDEGGDGTMLPKFLGCPCQCNYYDYWLTVVFSLAFFVP